MSFVRAAESEGGLKNALSAGSVVLHEDVTCSQLLRGAAMVVPRFTTYPFRLTLQK